MAKSYEGYTGTKWLSHQQGHSDEEHLKALIDAGLDRVCQNVRSLMAGYLDPKHNSPIFGGLFAKLGKGTNRHYVGLARELLGFVNNPDSFQNDAARDLHTLLTRIHAATSKMVYPNKEGTMHDRLHWILKRELLSYSQALDIVLTSDEENFPNEHAKYYIKQQLESLDKMAPKAMGKMKADEDEEKEPGPNQFGKGS